METTLAPINSLKHRISKKPIGNGRSVTRSEYYL